jgi:hypothetical protein
MRGEFRLEWVTKESELALVKAYEEREKCARAFGIYAPECPTFTFPRNRPRGATVGTLAMARMRQLLHANVILL